MSIFLSLTPLVTEKKQIKKVVYLLLILFICSTIHFSFKIGSIVSNSPTPICQDKIYLYIRVTTLTILGCIFAFSAQKVLNQVVKKTAKSIHSSTQTGKNSNLQIMGSIDHHFVLYQTYRLKILISLYFCVILYTIIKSFFQFMLNEGVPDELQRTDRQYVYSLYTTEPNLFYSSQNKEQTQVMGYVQIFEYGFRIIFGFFIPVIFVLQIFMKESQGPMRSLSGKSHARSEKEISKIQKEVIDPIYGLQYFS